MMELTEEQSNLVRLLHQRYVNNGDTLARKAAWEIEGMANASNNVTHPDPILTRLDLIGELKPCPFCGSTDIGGAGGIVSCYGCSIETRKQTTTDIAITVWNRRANDNVTSPEYISRLRGVMGEVVAFPAPDPLMAEAEGLGGISALAEHHAALTINPEFGAALWLDKRLVARIAADVASSVVTADDPEPQWHKDAMVFVNAVNGLVASPVAGEVKG